MRVFRSSRGAVSLVLSILIVLLTATPASAARPLPGSMSGTGDSITRAYNTCLIPYVDCPSRSWSTGSNATINSIYLRILAVNPGISGRAFNDARSGAKMVDLPGQMARASGRNVNAVTVQMGGNDVCTSTTSSMTSVKAFRASFTQALQTISANPNVSTVYVTSVPDVYRLWELFRNNFMARTVWSLFQVCQSLLARPTSMQEADVERRNAVRARNIAFNRVLEKVCAGFEICAFDGWAAFCTQFGTGDVTARDYFHPSRAGQRKLADVAWRAGPWTEKPTPRLGSDCLADTPA